MSTFTSLAAAGGENLQDGQNIIKHLLTDKKKSHL
jgi:hypothetical protein